MRNARIDMMELAAKNAALSVEVWNLKHAIGTTVDVRRDNGTTIRMATRSQAILMNGGLTAVIFVTGITGAYLLDRCTAVEEPANV